MTDSLSLLRAADALPSGEPATLATVVRVQGSSYRLPGARLLVDAGGRRTGSVSGGCLEADVARRGRLLHDGMRSQLVNYDGNDPDAAWGFGLGCNGSIDVFIERLSDARPTLELHRACDRRQARAAMVTIFAADGAISLKPGDRLWIDTDGRTHGLAEASAFAVALEASARDSLATGVTRSMTFASPGATLQALVEAILPPVPLVIFGAGYDAVPLVTAAKSLGWRVTVCDRRASHARADHFPGADAVHTGDPDSLAGILRFTRDTAAVVMSHSYDDDAQWVGRLLDSPVRYIGVLGPRARTQRMLDERGGSQGKWPDRLHAPVGLDIGADGPEQVALAVTAEIVSTLRNRPGGPLRQRIGPIHAPTSVQRVSLP